MFINFVVEGTMKEVFALFIAMVFLDVSCAYRITDDSKTTPKVPNGARNFLLNGANGTVYNYTLTAVRIDTNGLVTKKADENLPLTVIQSVGKNSIGYSYLIYEVYGENRSLVANDTSFWLGDSTGNVLSRQQLRMPFEKFTTFSEDTLNQGEKNLTITDVHKQIKTPCGVFTVITVQEVKKNDSLSTPKNFETETIWYAEGTAFVRQENIVTTTYSSGKTSILTQVIELNSIVKP